MKGLKVWGRIEPNAARRTLMRINAERAIQDATFVGAIGAQYESDETKAAIVGHLITARTHLDELIAEIGDATPASEPTEQHGVWQVADRHGKVLADRPNHSEACKIAGQLDLTDGEDSPHSVYFAMVPV